MKKLGNFYTCQRCGLSLKPWEIEQAHKRAKDEIAELTGENEERKERKKRKDRIRYRNWIEGRRDDD
ncbi:MAG: hypothetical protein INQ03_04690 [Candidatus Heimdallarchaeota archaeon]|nr:hypothetical protein [Candidatus Heimdallarchaeota archaeon]